MSQYRREPSLRTVPSPNQTKHSAQCFAARRVLEIVCAHRGVSIAALMHKTRCDAKVAEGRQIAMYLMHTQIGQTLTQVGAFMGRDRTTVAYACSKVEDLRDNFEFDQTLSELESVLESSLGQGDGFASGVAESGRH